MKIKLFHIPAILLLLAGISGLSSCDDSKSCNAPVDSFLGITFHYMIDDEREADTTLPALTMYGIGREDSLLALNQPVNSVFVPLKQTADTTRFYLQTDSTSHGGDTITVMYKRSLHFISPGCGFSTNYTLDSVHFTRHYIDSVWINRPDITTSNVENLKLYF
ncbi:DUF6452 family protein [Compostibacter hankyongensis]|uniref:DUF6452 family protein n=1 Tax=Compostibacter hankyongensis TaxID=1007089 RepID=UPI0031E8C846